MGTIEIELGVVIWLLIVITWDMGKIKKHFMGED